MGSNNICAQQKITNKNLVTDFGAKPNDTGNDTKAFEKAAEYINKMGGNVLLFIPKGKYWVGQKQLKYSSSANIFMLSDCKNVQIVGEKDTEIKYINRLYFGMFDTADRKKPTNINLYNPSSLENELHKTEGNDAAIKFSKNAIDIGTCFSFKFCTNIKIENIALNGNSNTFILGGYCGIGQRPYERIHYGIVINNCNNVIINKSNVSYFGTDALVVTSHSYTQKEKDNYTNTISISNSKFYASGRNNFSLTGGKNIALINCEFSNAANTRICTAPGAGISIEPEFNTVSNVLFKKCNVFGNNGCAITDGYIIDTNIVYKNCNIASSNSYAIICGSVKSVYENCIISGCVLSQYNATKSEEATKFTNCQFNDTACKDGKCFYVYLIGVTGNMQQFVNCNFSSKYLPIFYVEVQTKKTDDYILFNNCNFKFTGTSAPVLGNHSAFLVNTVIKNSDFTFNKLYPPNFTGSKNNVWYNISLNNKKIEDSK
ncbi:MAG: hypothetical protein ABL929_07495 [Ferruginibacter sp.]|nr:hypothetical protein [Ferruginibacter sp.]